MKIAGISSLRNEADIVEVFVRYHLQIVDRLLIINHRSTDSTGQILRDLQKEGLPIEVFEETSMEYKQSEFMTKLLRKAVADFNPDWVLPLDVDEFIAAPGKATVRHILEELPDDKIIKVYYHSYVPHPSDDWQEPDVLKRIQHRRILEKQQLGKIMIPRTMAKRRYGIIAAGNHNFVKMRFGKQKAFSSVKTDDLFLAHFPVRSSQQIMSKAFATWLAILSKPDKEPTEGFHVKLLFDRFIANGQIQPEELSNMALNYPASKDPETLTSDNVIRDPLLPERRALKLRYNAAYTCNPLSLVARVAEELAEAVASARKKSYIRKLLGKLG